MPQNGADRAAFLNAASSRIETHAAQPRKERRAVLFADVADSTALMGRNENQTYLSLTNLKSELLEPCFEENGCHIKKDTGDGLLGTFPTALAAARCAVAIQRRCLEIASRFPREEQLLFRMGLHVSEIIIDGNDVHGEGVNIAARLMALAEPGDIILEEAAARAAQPALESLPWFDIGELYLKGVGRPVRAVGVRIGSAGLVRLPKVLGVVETRPSITVLPFRTMTGEGIEDLLGRIMVAEITHALSSIKDLFVISHSSALSPDLDGLELREIGRQLGVRYILQGEVGTEGGRVTIFTKLTEAATGRIIGSKRHASSTLMPFELRTEIAVSATRSIAPYIRDWELQRAMRKHPESLTAYDLVLRAQQLLYKLDQESHARARGLLQQAIALDPTYGPSYSWLAYWHIFRVGEWLSLNPETDAVEAARVAHVAIELDERDALARAIYGHVQSFLFRDYESALPHFKRAIQDGPNCPEAWSMSSVTLGYLGKGETAVEHAAYGLHLSPLDAHIFYKESSLAQAHYVNSDYEAAVAWARKAQSHNPAAMFNDRVLSASLAALGRVAEAQCVARSMLQRTPDFRLAIYKRRCPFRGAALDTWIERLHHAGLPD